MNAGLQASVPCLLSVPSAAHQTWARWVVGRFCGHVLRTLHAVFHGDPSQRTGFRFPHVPTSRCCVLLFLFSFQSVFLGGESIGGNLKPDFE